MSEKFSRWLCAWIDLFLEKIRAWTTLGLAIRCAQALGMHLQNTTPTLTDAAKDFRIHIWYSIVSLERVMTVMTSRPSMIRERDCSVPLPSLNSQYRALADQKPDSTSLRDLPRHTLGPSLSWPAFGSVAASEKPSLLPSRRLNSTTYFRYYVEINALAQLVVTRLYNPEVRHLKWSEIQRRILELDEKLVEWASNLPMNINVQDLPPRDAAGKREPLQQALGILFYVTRTIINRPCLCRLDRLIARQSDMSLDVNRDMANKCVHSAQAMLAFLPDEPELDIIYASPLWWAMHRHVKRAGTVLLLELAFRVPHMPSQSEQLLVDAKKAVRWLRTMATTSAPAEQAWTALSWLLKRAGQRVGGDTTDVIDPSDAQQQQQWRRRRLQLQHNPFHEQQQQQQQRRSLQPVRDTTHSMGHFSAPAESRQPLDDIYSRDPQMPSHFLSDLETLELDQFGFPQAGTGLPSLFPTVSEMHDLRADEEADEDADEDDGGDDDDDDDDGDEVARLGGVEDGEDEDEDEDEDEVMKHVDDMYPRSYDWRAEDGT